MSFFGRAYGAAADEYGKQRAEKYGRVARAWRGFQIVVIIALGIGIFYMWSVGHQ